MTAVDRSRPGVASPTRVIELPPVTLPGDGPNNIPSRMRHGLLEHALAAFDEGGLIGTSIGDISKASATSVGGIYHHFTGKEDLAGAVYMACLQDFQRAFADAVKGDAERGVRAGVTALLDWCLRDEPGKARFLLTAGDSARGSAAEELRAANRIFFARILAWWDPLAASGDLKKLDFEVAHAVWLGPGMEYSRLRLAGRARAGRGAARALGDAAWDALKGAT
jgi:AcrR family transcriptional regulator